MPGRAQVRSYVVGTVLRPDVCLCRSALARDEAFPAIPVAPWCAPTWVGGDYSNTIPTTTRMKMPHLSVWYSGLLRSFSALAFRRAA
ncbi:hypothetical protein F6Y24_10360 [Xanthomonas arboricola pv. pruni]|nr:hypothetical protein F6Y24_10360 [Xanthomonas arboricola pv. pruni]RST71060.1 hypothetical protein EJK96_07665 [Xanthomonas arboricola pv. pruni]RST81461.1 hypothetical protein EJL05_03265 [Xanthomonas arboricola pv. pruni]